MAKKLIVGNWKMHFTTGEASLYLHKLEKKIEPHHDVSVVVCPNVLTLQTLSVQVNRRKLKLGAQNCYFQDEGAFTGEVSARMLHGIADYVIIGHSERRHVLNESDKDITRKVQAVVRNGMKVILCVGETKQERVDGETAHAIHAQVTNGLANVTSEEMSQVVIAYEPVWAIGTGDFAEAPDATRAAKLIRKHIEAMFGRQAAKEVPVLYGGSVNGDNASAYLSATGIDGLLVGGASLKAEEFVKIVSRAHSLVGA